MESVAAGFSRIFSTNLKICLLCSRLCTHHQFQSFQRFSWNFLKILKFYPNFLKFYFNPQIVGQLLHSLSVDNILVPFHLWWKETKLKWGKVYKYFAQGCLKVFILGFTSLKMHWNYKNDEFLVEKSKTS